VPPLDKWSGSTIGTLPIGHGIAITPVQMAAAYGTLANDGVWLQPHLVDRIGRTIGRCPTSRRILTPAVSRRC
jgi:cell division protein FtsI (penicillin-binding protein 3)